MTTAQPRRILIVEDDFFLSEDMRAIFVTAGADVLGPVGTLKDAAFAIASDLRIDGAVIDVNLHGEFAFPIADMLTARSIPFVFVTGYDRSILPQRFGGAMLYEKPIDATRLLDAMAPVLAPAG